MFFTYDQMNSGGSYYENDYVRQYVIVEADDADQAYKIVQEAIDDYRDYCECCGERWFCWDKPEGTLMPNTYNGLVEVKDPSIIIYSQDGIKSYFDVSKKAMVYEGFNFYAQENVYSLRRWSNDDFVTLAVYGHIDKELFNDILYEYGEEREAHKRIKHTYYTPVCEDDVPSGFSDWYEETDIEKYKYALPFTCIEL